MFECPLSVVGHEFFPRDQLRNILWILRFILESMVSFNRVVMNHIIVSNIFRYFGKRLAAYMTITFALSEEPCMVEIQATVTCTGTTGVEMEALTAVSAAALTIYDMCKAVQKDMRITDIRLLEKSAGKSGDYKMKE